MNSKRKRGISFGFHKGGKHLRALEGDNQEVV